LIARHSVVVARQCRALDQAREADIRYNINSDNRSSSWVHCESRVAVAVAWGQLENPGRGISIVGSRYQRTCEEQQTKRTQYEP
jgi:hypothetical protein